MSIRQRWASLLSETTRYAQHYQRRQSIQIIRTFHSRPHRCQTSNIRQNYKNPYFAQSNHHHLIQIVRKLATSTTTTSSSSQSSASVNSSQISQQQIITNETIRVDTTTNSSSPIPPVSSSSLTRREFYRLLSRELFWSFFLIIQFCGLMFFIRHYFYDLMACVGPSMMPTMNASGDLVLTQRFYKNIQRGDVIVAISPNNPQHLICKRIIGLSGDPIFVNDRKLIIPAGHIWVQGDNLNNSSDSRMYGPLPIALIKGKVIAKIWPSLKFVESTMKFKQVNDEDQQLNENPIMKTRNNSESLSESEELLLAWQKRVKPSIRILPIESNSEQISNSGTNDKPLIDQ